MIFDQNIIRYPVHAVLYMDKASGKLGENVIIFRIFIAFLGKDTLSKELEMSKKSLVVPLLFIKLSLKGLLHDVHNASDEF